MRHDPHESVTSTGCPVEFDKGLPSIRPIQGHIHLTSPRVRRTHIHLDSHKHTTGTVSIATQIPGPTIRMKACETYHLTVTNTLEGPNPDGAWNTMKDPNTTNIHTHGLHISGEGPADDVLFVKITPGMTHTCKYLVPV